MRPDTTESDPARDDLVQPPGDPPTPTADRVWPAFVVVAAAMALSIAGQIVLVVLLVAAGAARGEAIDPDSIERLTEDFFMSPVGFMVAAGIGQLAFIACVLVATWRSSGNRVERLGLYANGPLGAHGDRAPAQNSSSAKE